ncbi:LOW QUALITY PROTEIN: hypothetical protein ACHAW6_013198 [Cyclotella cf. meneghiniana]
MQTTSKSSNQPRYTYLMQKHQHSHQTMMPSCKGVAAHIQSHVPLKTNTWDNTAAQTPLKTQYNLDITEYSYSVYELPNMEQVIQWHHAAAGYPTKARWIKVKKAGFFATLPKLMAKALSDETAKEHMKRIN